MWRSRSRIIRGFEEPIEEIFFKNDDREMSIIDAEDYLNELEESLIMTTSRYHSHNHLVDNWRECTFAPCETTQRLLTKGHY